MWHAVSEFLPASSEGRSGLPGSPGVMRRRRRGGRKYGVKEVAVVAGLHGDLLVLLHSVHLPAAATQRTVQRGRNAGETASERESVRPEGTWSGRRRPRPLRWAPVADAAGARRSSPAPSLLQL